MKGGASPLQARLRKGQLLEPEHCLRVACLHFPSVGLELEPWRHFQTVGLPRAATRRNRSFWRASRREERAAARMDDSLDTFSAPQAALASSVTVRRNRRAPLPWRQIALPACRQHKLDRHLEGKGRQISHENIQRLWKGDFCTGWPIPAKASWCLDFSCCVFSRFHIRVAATELTEQ